MNWPRWLRRADTGVRRAGAAALVVLGACAAQSATTLEFTLPRESTTSAGVYDLQGRLQRTLWSGERLAAGEHRRVVETDDLSAGEQQVALIHHDVRPVWEGVVGNTSTTFTGPGVHRAFHAPTGLAIAGERVYYATGFNEQHRSLHAFDMRDPQRDLAPFDHVDTFAGLALVATDGTRLYAANLGGLVRTSFVMAFDLARGRPHEWPEGSPLCLNRRPGSPQCFSFDYRGVIDVETDAAAAPTGLAVQPHGRVLAVAHAGRGSVQFFDKDSGRRLGELAVDLALAGSNQLAFAPDGDLWVISHRRVRRYTGVPDAPTLVATIDDVAAPLAVAVHPADADTVWIADGAARQQLRRFDRHARATGVLGAAGGYTNDPRVAPDKLCFVRDGSQEQSALAIAPDGSLWIADTCNNRMLHWREDGSFVDQVAYQPASYAAVADATDTRRVMSNFLEFRVDDATPLAPGRGWTLVRNWLPGLPASLRDTHTANRQFAGVIGLATLANGRTYAMVASAGRDAIVELPSSGPMRVLRMLARPDANATRKVLYENGDLGWAVVRGGVQVVLRQRLAGFDDRSDPLWASEPERMVSVPVRPGTPHERGAWTGVSGPRFPITAGGHVVLFDPSVTGNEGFHLGAARQGDGDWLWMASPSAPLDGRGSFQTREADRKLRRVDRGIQYGGNIALAAGAHIVYGFHGEFYTDQSNGKVGQANQFMHFHENGLFIGQFGVPQTRATMEAQAGLSGNAFSPSLVVAGRRLYLYHNDESAHGGVHRWRLDGWDDVVELKGRGRSGTTIVLR